MQIGNWSRLLTDLFGMDADDILKEDQIKGEDDGRKGLDAEFKSFCLLNALSDLLMLPKDMLIDRSIRKEVSFMNMSLEQMFLFIFFLITSLKLFILISFIGLPFTGSATDNTDTLQFYP